MNQVPHRPAEYKAWIPVWVRAALVPAGGAEKKVDPRYSGKKETDRDRHVDEHVDFGAFGHL